MVRLILTIWFAIFCLVVLAQQPFGQANYWSETLAFDTISHWGYQPCFKTPEVNNQTNKSWFNRKLFSEHFVTFSDSSLFLFIDPMINVNATTGNDKFLQNGRGLHAGVVIDQSIEAETWLMENQTGAISNHLVHHRYGQTAIYGYGRSKINKDTSAYDFAWAMARLAIKIKPWWITEIGYGRQHIGVGYRSLLLSNQMVPYPYLKNTWRKGKISYSHQLSAWNTLVRAEKTANTEAPFLIQKNKIETVDFNLTNNLTVSYIAGAIWDDNREFASIENTIHVIPIPGVINFLGDSLLQLNGMQFNYRHNNVLVYGQLLNSKQQIKRTAVQAGLLLQVNAKNLQGFFRMEYNTLPTNFYDNFSNSWSNQTYYAGYVGREAKELLLRAQVRQKKMFLAVGTNLLVANNLNKASDLVKSITFEAQYQINPSNGLAIFSDIQLLRAAAIKNSVNDEFYDGNVAVNQKWISIGIRTSLLRVFQDY